MVNLTLYGKPTSTFEYLKMSLLSEAKAKGILLHIAEVSDTDAFVTEQLMSIPSIKIDNEFRSIEEQDLNKFIQEVNQWIMEKETFKKSNHLIVPTDYSDSAQNALNYAIAMSENTQNSISVLHVHHPSVLTTDSSSYVDPQIEIYRRDELNHYVDMQNQKLKDDNLAVAKMNAVFLEGFAAEQIQYLAEKTDDGIVVMGSTGKSGIMKSIFGSVSTEVAKHCAKPVMIIPGDQQFAPLNQVLYCSEDLYSDSLIMKQLIDLVGQYDATIHVVHFQKIGEDNERDLLEVWQNFYPKTKLKAKFLYGSDRLSLLEDYANLNAINMIAMVAGDRSIVGDLFHRSFTKKLAINTSLPLCVLHK